MPFVWVQELVRGLHPVLVYLAGIPLLVFLAVTALTSLFVVGYLYKGFQVWWQLRSAIYHIDRLRRSGFSTRPVEVARVFRWAPLSHVWHDYAGTLHEIAKTPGSLASTVEIRATAPAETFFNREVLVDGRLFDDFTRHLPGVLTGLGIIGTFAGLLDGLANFDPSTTVTAVAGLKPLIAGVQHAFIVSALAIGCAMFVIFVSKFVLAYLYGLVERLAHCIDSLYSSGAGEEYLARLVKVSEMHEVVGTRLKDALVEDLGRLMKNLAEKQISTQFEANKALGRHLGASISGSLAEPVERLTEAMVQHCRVNSEMLAGLTQAMPPALLSKIEETCASQLSAIMAHSERSRVASESILQSLTELASEIAATSNTATEQVSGKFAEAMGSVSAVQALPSVADQGSMPVVPGVMETIQGPGGISEAARKAR